MTIRRLVDISSTSTSVTSPVRSGVLALQGDVREHAAILTALGAEAIPVRRPEQLDGLDGLVIPGGESTAITRLMRLYGIDEALRSFGGERDYRGWEPGGDEFLSPALTAALLMSKVMDRDDFAPWFDAFLPEPAMARFEPVHVSDRSDGKIAHLDGLNLSRAWCWRGIASTLAEDDQARVTALEAAETHLASALPHVAGDYMGEHWLASFALLALLE